MDQIKIGAFIASLRKEKNLTQKELADILHVSDRAISKWENGRGLPEVSSLQPLCEALDISVSELLNGERKKEDNEEKIEETILNTLEYSEHKMKKSKKGFITILLVIFILLTLLFALFGIDITRMNHNEPVLFSTWGFKYAPAIDLKEDFMEIAIEDYLVEEAQKSSAHYHNETWFSSIQIFLMEEVIKESEYIVYAWV